jgi:ABC-type polysaccharide/polyol phosphate transport system ATPase subunit
MSDIAISVRNLSKKYRLYDSPQHRLKEALHPFRKKYHRDFWALKDVSFEVKRGETVGLIGRNGCGKSTLLQLICGTLTPSEGEVVVKGRISALLELGAGFNPQFTGRQNLYMNGALLGFTKEQMDERYPMIAEFADIGDFIDQPVKTYSSGMYVRLAFAIAINVDPDILIIDEALSVGDALFQQRCIARIRAMIDSGVTMLFVSHSAETIRALCKNGIWLENGCTRMIDEAVKVSNAYLNEIYLESNRLKAERVLPSETSEQDSIPEPVNRTIIEEATRDVTTTKGINIHYVRLKNTRGEVVNAFHQGEDFEVEIQLSSGILVDNLSVGILIKDNLGIDLTGESIFNKYRKGITLRQGEVATVSFRSKLLLRGGENYGVGLSLNSVSKWNRRDNILLYKDDAAAVFKVLADLEQPLWFKFYQDFEISVNVR